MTAVFEGAIRQAESELKSWAGVVPQVEISVIRPQTFGEVALWEVFPFTGGIIGVENAVVFLVACDGVGEFAGGGDVSVEDRGQGSTTVLAGEVRENDGRDVGVGDPRVENADASIVDGYYSIGASRGYVIDQVIGELICVLSLVQETQKRHRLGTIPLKRARSRPSPA